MSCSCFCSIRTSSTLPLCAREHEGAGGGEGGEGGGVSMEGAMIMVRGSMVNGVVVWMGGARETEQSRAKVGPNASKSQECTMRLDCEGRKGRQRFRKDGTFCAIRISPLSLTSSRSTMRSIFSPPLRPSSSTSKSSPSLPSGLIWRRWQRKKIK
jgi:hypothetical protein